MNTLQASIILTLAQCEALSGFLVLIDMMLLDCRASHYLRKTCVEGMAMPLRGLCAEQFHCFAQSFTLGPLLRKFELTGAFVTHKSRVRATQNTQRVWSYQMQQISGQRSISFYVSPAVSAYLPLSLSCCVFLSLSLSLTTSLSLCLSLAISLADSLFLFSPALVLFSPPLYSSFAEAPFFSGLQCW